MLTLKIGLLFVASFTVNRFVGLVCILRHFEVCDRRCKRTVIPRGLFVASFVVVNQSHTIPNFLPYPFALILSLRSAYAGSKPAIAPAKFELEPTLVPSIAASSVLVIKYPTV